MTLRHLLHAALSLLALATLTSRSNAQDTRPVSCRLICIDGATPPGPLLHGATRETEITVEVPTDNLSAPVACAARNHTIQFLAKDSRKPVANATIPPTARHAVLLFLPAKPTDSLPWQIFVIEDNPRNFPDGGGFVANFYQHDIRFVIGEHKIQLRPAKSTHFAQPTQRDDFNMAPVVFQFQQGDSWRTASESLVRFIPGVRFLLVAYVDPASGRPKIATYQDLTPPPAAKP